MSTGAGVTIARRITARRLNRRALESSTGPFVGPSFRFNFALQQLSPSITVRPNPSYGLLTSVWLVSWAGPLTIESSSDSFPCSYRTPLEHGLRTSHLDRSTTRMTWKRCSKGTSKGPTCTLATLGTSGAANRSRASPSATISNVSPNSALSFPTSPTPTSSWLSSMELPIRS
jgi:hypothetical protein